MIANSDLLIDDTKCEEIQSTIKYFINDINTVVIGFLEETAKTIDLHRGSNISGFMFILRINVIEKIGFLDESFFMYGEEQDFFRRVEKVGFKIIQSGIRVKHISEGSGGPSLRNAWLAIRNSIYLEVKMLNAWCIFKKIITLFLIINRLYKSKDQDDPSLRRVRRPGILLGNVFLVSAIVWNLIKFFIFKYNELKS